LGQMAVGMMTSTLALAALESRLSGTLEPEPISMGSLAGCVYHPSAIEAAWTTSPAAGNICEMASSDEQVAAAHEWLQFASDSRGSTTKGNPPPSLSSWRCPDGRVEYIEPLIGMARHPFAAVGCDFAKFGNSAARNMTTVDLFNISFLIPANNCGENKIESVTGRHIFYDLGCTVYSNGLPLAYDVGGARSPSLPLFDHMYAQQCLPLDHLYGWEMTEHEPSSWWDPVPAAVRPRLTFYNVAIEEDYQSDASFSSHLKAAAKPEDFVAIKVDIDHVAVELPIVKGIARRSDITALVDEVYFEYHFDFDDLDFGWHSQKGGESHVNDTVDDALALMSELRRAGVRSHFWI